MLVEDLSFTLWIMQSDDDPYKVAVLAAEIYVSKVIYLSELLPSGDSMHVLLILALKIFC